MVTRRIRRRHRLLGAYVRVELEERGVSIGDPSARPEEAPATPLPPGTTERDAGDPEDARKERPA